MGIWFSHRWQASVEPQTAERFVTVSTQITPEMAAIIKARLLVGDLQHDIAADLRINQGRISEINTGKRFANVPPASNDNQEGVSHEGA